MFFSRPAESGRPLKFPVSECARPRHAAITGRRRSGWSARGVVALAAFFSAANANTPTKRGLRQAAEHAARSAAPRQRVEGMEERLVNSQTQVLDKRPWVDGPTIVGILSLVNAALGAGVLAYPFAFMSAGMVLASRPHDRDRSAVDVLSVYHHALHDHPAGVAEGAANVKSFWRPCQVRAWPEGLDRPGGADRRVHVRRVRRLP